MRDCVGHVLVVKNPQKSINLWGHISEIADQILPVIEKNDYGDCLCFLKDKGLVDVDAVDVKQFIPKLPTNSTLNLIESFLKGRY
jgi:hypothetical protein